MKALITGGAGFIGSHLVRYLLRETACTILNVDRLTFPGSIHTIETIGQSDRHRFLRFDVTDGAALRSVLHDFAPDAVIHVAAESHVDRSIDSPRAFIDSNIVGTFNVLEAARHHWQGLPPARRERFRFLHVSTDEVFGSLAATAPAFSETDPYDPHSPYAASKAASDHLVRAWHHTYGLPVIVTNCSNNFGPFQFPEKLIPLMITKAMNGEPLPLYGTGENVRDWLFVEDHVAALHAVLERGTIGDRYNIGGDSELPNIDVVHKICDLLDEFHPRPGAAPRRQLVRFVADRPGHDFRYAMNTSKIGRELDWAPQVGFSHGLRRTVAWYLENRAWCELVTADSDAGHRLGLATA